MVKYFYIRCKYIQAHGVLAESEHFVPPLWMTTQCLLSRLPAVPVLISVERLGQVLSKANHHSCILYGCLLQCNDVFNLFPSFFLDQTMNGILGILKVLSGLMWTASEALPLGSQER